MSQGSIKRFPETHIFSKNRHTFDFPTQLDERLHHLSESILPRQPYLLSVPSDVPYRHSSRFINTWYEGTPFDRTEEQVQYVSFLPHLGDHESLLKVEGGWADDQGNPVEEELSPKTVPASGRNTPLETGHRKKISLKDYKTKGKSPSNSTPQPQLIKVAEKVQTTDAKSEPEKQEPSEDSKERNHDQVVRSKQNAKVLDPESKIPSLDGPYSPRNSPPVHPASPPSPTQKRKLSPPLEDCNPTMQSPKAESQASVMKMPRLLSPTLPSPGRENGLPQLLSPVLPPSLAKVISSPLSSISIGSPAGGTHQRTEPVRSILAGAELDNDPFPVPDKSRLAPGDSRVRSDSQHSARSSAPGTPNAAKVALGAKVLSKAAVRAGTPLHNGARASPGPRQRHTIILKYGKRNRKRVEALLKFAARPKKEARKTSPLPGVAQPKKETIKQESTDTRQVASTKTKVTAFDNDKSDKSEKKRKAEDSPGPSLKKSKSANLTVEKENRPSTPVAPASKAPLVSQSRTTFSTPKKDLKSAAMRRVESSDGVDVSTPSGDRVRVSTPLAVPKPSPQPTTSSDSREDERQQWTSVNTKFFTLGRTLKHEADSMLSSFEGDSKPGHSAKTVMIQIEALLCFMINICAQSHARPGADPGWRSIILYHISVFRASRRHPHLHGLVIQLGAVCRQLIQRHDLDRLSRDPLPEDYCNSAPTPGSDGNTKTNEDGEKYKKRYMNFKNDLVQNARELQTAWLDGSRQLSLDLLRREYPITWSMRATDTSMRLQEKPSPSKITKAFYLPMDSSTTAFEAARFGVAFLEEWAEKEKIEWKTRIDL